MLPALVFHPIYSQLTLPQRHRFPIEKYQGIYDALRLRGIPAEAFKQPSPVEIALLAEHFCSDYVAALCAGTLDVKAMRRIGFPWSEQLILRTRTAVGGTLLTAQLALEQGLALNLTGGYHHAYYDFGSGFCLFNDLFLAARQILHHPSIERVLIIDCDVHQGDGTARLAQGNEAITTLSLHGEKNFPHRKQHSDLDFGLPNGCQDDEYLTTLEQALQLAFVIARPDFVIYDAGVDIHEHDDLGLLAITSSGIEVRDKMVLDACVAHGIPVACVIGGGYQRNIAALVEVHLNLFRASGVI